MKYHYAEGVMVKNKYIFGGMIVGGHGYSLVFLLEGGI
jgi:hypothetical protein